jgi:restriction endonuclease S subunit
MRDGWTETTLGEVVNIQKGKKPSAIDIYQEFSRPYLTADVLRGAPCKQFIPETEAGLCVELSGHEAVLLWDGAGAGDVFKSQPGILASTMAKVESKNVFLVCNGYLYLYLDSKQTEIKSSCRGTTVPHISPEALRNLNFCLPPLEEQWRIVDVMSSVDAYIDALQRQADTARIARNAVLHELLSIGDDDWTKTTLGDISEVAYGYTESASETEVGPKFLRITDIQNDNVDWSLVPYCRIEKEKFEKQRLQNGDIVFARTGATTGKSFLILNPPPAVCASYLIRLRPIKTVVIPYFLNINFQTEEYWMNIKSGMSGSAQGGFNASKLSSLSVWLPMLEEQKWIVEIVSSIDEMIRSTEQAVADAKSLRSGLLSDLLSGEHEIPASYGVFVGAA